MAGYVPQMAADVPWMAGYVAARDVLPIPGPGAEESRLRAEEVLSRPEFDRPDPSIVERVIVWVGERLSELWVLLGAGAGGGGTVLAWGILLLLVGLVLLLVLAVGRTLRRDHPDPEPAESQPSRRSTTWRSEAERHEAAGEWRAALRCRYRALVADLAERGVLREVPGRTAGEYRRDVAARDPEVAGEFAHASELFERAWYGGLPVGTEENDRFRELASKVLSGSGR